MTEVYCKLCYRIQPYDPATMQPEKCVQCDTHFSMWHIAGQLKTKEKDIKYTRQKTP